MKTAIQAVITVLIVQVLAAIGFVYSGIFNVAATDPHWSLTQAIMETARVRSIKTRAAGILPPGNLGDHKRVVGGTSHFAEHCSSCHSAPGVESGEVAKGMYPSPPTLTNAVKQWAPGELFWIIRNGIKMSGMSAWPSHSDEDIWDIIAFLNKLTSMSEQDYGELIKESMEAGGHKVHGDDCAPEHRAAGHC